MKEFLDRVLLKDLVPLEKPISIFIEPTNRCTFSCLHCPISLQDYKERIGQYTLSMEDFLHIALDIKKSFKKVKVINFYMLGEPFLNSNLFKFVSKCKELDIAEYVRITTNGSLLSESVYQSIFESGLDVLTISIYGLSDIEYKKTTQREFKFDKLVKNIENFLSHRSKITGGKKPFLQISYFNTCEEKKKEVLEKFGKLVDHVHFQDVLNWTEEDNLFLNKVEHFKTPNKDVKVCPSPFYQLVVHSNLDVSICCNDWAKKLKVGSLRQNSLYDIWHSNEWNQIRLKMLKDGYKSVEGCKNCITPKYTVDSDNLDSLTFEEYIRRYKLYVSKK